MEWTDQSEITVQIQLCLYIQKMDASIWKELTGVKLLYK